MPEIFPIIYGVFGPPIQFGASPKHPNSGDFDVPIALVLSGGVPAGYIGIRIGSPASYQAVRIGSTSAYKTPLVKET